MDAERERDVCARAAPDTGAVESTRERFQADFDVLEAARVEERQARDTARAPELGDAVVLRVAELAVELRVAYRTQRVLVEDRDPAPLGRVIQFFKSNIFWNSFLPERRTQCPLHRGALALALQAVDLGAGLGELQRTLRKPMKRFWPCGTSPFIAARRRSLSGEFSGISSRASASIG